MLSDSHSTFVPKTELDALKIDSDFNRRIPSVSRHIYGANLVHAATLDVEDSTKIRRDVAIPLTLKATDEIDA